jgi:septum formation protein
VELFVESTKTIVLASSSPRRRELLERIGLVFIVDPSGEPEETPSGLDPSSLAKTLSLRKAAAVAGRHPDAVVIAADTFGVLKGRILGKPHTAAEAVKMLKLINGKSHRVVTGLTVIDSATFKVVTRVVETRVFIQLMTDQSIERYVATGEPLDKAGAYAIQGLGSVIVQKIVGDYYNVMGLPLNALAGILLQFGIHVL